MAEFNAALPQFGDIIVFGLSPDPVESHKKFSESLGLKFSLLADPGRELIETLGVWVEKSLYGKKYWGVERSTFLVGTVGRVERVWRKVSPAGHADEVLAALSAPSDILGTDGTQTDCPSHSGDEVGQSDRLRDCL